MFGLFAICPCYKLDLVPLLVQICVSVVEANGLDTIGIYRIPGNTAAVNALKETLSQHLDTMTLENLDVSDPRWRDVNVVSSLLKMFLRKLPEPLLTDKLYPFFIDANRIASHHNRLHKLRNLLRKLPRHHYATLKYIIYHLSEITKNSQVNKMETRNLALMFGPSIVRPSDDNMATMVTHMSDQCKIIETLIHYLVPLLVQICVSVVEANGLDTIGIYRIPGNTAAVNALKETLSQHLDTMTLENVGLLDVSDPRWRDVNVVSSLLKMFLRKLPEPLLTDKLYPFFIDANRIASHHNRLHKLRNLLRKLPRHHYATLKYIIYHLSEITKNSQVNKMETRNLALMFGPSIVRPSDDNMATMVTHMSDQCKIIETLIHYHEWMFNDNSPADDAVPEQHPSETGGPPLEAPQYGVGVPTGVSAASFNDMHNLIRKANEDQAAAMMAEGKGGKIKNILRRNSRRDKSKSKLKIESTAPAAVNPRGGAAPTANHTVAHHPAPHPVTHSPTTQSSVDSAFCGNYQERDIDAEIMSRQTVSPLAAAPPSNLEESPSVESSIGSIPDTSRTDPGTTTTTSSTVESGEVQARRKRQQDIYSARRIFIAGSAAAADDTSAVDDLANHTHHLNIANTPALEVLSEETREKIRKMQRRQNWMDPLPFTFPSHVANTSHPVPTAPPPAQPEPSPPTATAPEVPKTNSPTKDMTDALSCTSDYSTTSSAPLTAPLAVACAASSSDYASSFSDPSPCARNASASPRQRPQVLGVLPEARCQQKIRIRSRTGPRDPTRRHTLSDMDVLKVGRF
ncbi:RhoGAP domain protein [Oesophagostomum dentatum]|uniref:RhoGAP domain protein n=1 Tax=Oesophagostomum dentatum TaxID=61180 RepID=A0A0B1THS7_OESDE|nr:RhoGAP domain protein [Oesophagostomum dentatum]